MKPAQSHPMTAPNILLLCPDELKASALGLYGQALPVSPNLDRLAAECAVFTQCHTVHPKCVPSRAALLTAQYPHVNGHRTLQLHVKPHEPNLVATLKQAGYQTALFGKNHVVEESLIPATFDYWAKDAGRNTLEAPDGGARLPRGSYWVGQDPVPLAEWRDQLNTAHALHWIDQKRDPAKPFFAWLNWDSPHPPYKVPAPFYGMTDRSKVTVPPTDSYADKPAYHRRLAETYGLLHMNETQWRELVATYLDMVTFIDAQVKHVLDHLQKTGLAKNTIVVLWSDHGDFAGEHQLVEKWDTSFYDCITRVPLVLWAPGRVKPLRSDALVESIDLLPTLLELCGVPLPRGLQGRSLGPVLRGETTAHRDLVLCQGGQERAMLLDNCVVAPNAKPRPCVAYQLKQQALYDEPMINARAKMIRDHQWKYIWRDGGPEELYDLRCDPHELRNLAASLLHAQTLETYRLKMIGKLVEAETVAPHQDFVEA
jgi:arylsulfatase A-like enzyme